MQIFNLFSKLYLQFLIQMQTVVGNNLVIIIFSYSHREIDMHIGKVVNNLSYCAAHLKSALVNFEKCDFCTSLFPGICFNKWLWDICELLYIWRRRELITESASIFFQCGKSESRANHSKHVLWLHIPVQCSAVSVNMCPFDGLRIAEWCYSVLGSWIIPWTPWGEWSCPAITNSSEN